MVCRIPFVSHATPNSPSNCPDPSQRHTVHIPVYDRTRIRARDKGTLERLLGRLGRVSLLVLDDWGLQGFSAQGRRDLLEIVEARHGCKSILVASQVSVESAPNLLMYRNLAALSVVAVVGFEPATFRL